MGNCMRTPDHPSSLSQRIRSSPTQHEDAYAADGGYVNVESEALASLDQLKNQIDKGNVQPNDVIHRLHLFLSRLQQENSTTKKDEGEKGAFDEMVDNVIQKWEAFSDTGIPQAVAKVTAQFLEKLGDTSYMLVGLSLVGSMLTRALNIPKNTDACNKFMKCLACLLAILDSHLSKTSNSSPLSIERVATLMNQGIIVCWKYTSSSFGRRFVDAQVLQAELDEISETLRNEIQVLHLETQFNTYYKLEQIDQKLEQLDRKFDRSRTVWYNRTQDAEDDQSSVGIKQRVEEVRKLLAIREKDVKGSAVILYGQGGIGKTTLASKVIKSLQSDPSFGFVCACIDLDTYKQDLVSQVRQLQEDLIQQLSKDNQKGKVSDKIFGHDKLKDLFKARSCFIFINNVVKGEQLKGLLPENLPDLGNNKLRILVTSRDMDARVHLPFPPHYIKVYTVKELDDDLSVLVLQQHIGVTSPEQQQFEGELDKIAEVASLCKGIPILLTAIGKDLKFNRGKLNYYDTTIQRLEKADFSNYRSEGVEDILGSVFDLLSDDCKRTFLDICMFFVEGRWDFACHSFGDEAMEDLTERFMIQKPDEDSGTVTVHDIYRSISLKRLKSEESYFSLDLSDLGEGDGGCVELKDVLEDEGLSLEKLQGLCIQWADDRNISLDPHILPSLRLFQIASAKLEVKNENGKAFQKLEYFTAEYSDVTNIHMMLMKKGKRSSSLKVLSLERCSNLSGLLDGIDKLQSLQILHLRRCTSISPNVPFHELPSTVSNLPNLRKLLLPGCDSIKVLPDNLGDLESLEELDLSSTGIQNLPPSISDLQYLKKLDMSGCDGIQSLPNEMGMLSSLEYLDLSYCDKLEQLPSKLSGMISLKFLNMDSCTSIKELSNDLGKLSSLEELNLSDCNSLENLPSSISGLQNLKELKMSFCSTIKLLPNEIGMLKSLENLYLNYCQNLQHLPSEVSGMVALKTLDMDNCEAIEALPDDLGKLGSLKVLSLSGCSNLQKLPSDMSELHRLEKLDMTDCEKVECLPDDFGMLLCLEDLNLTRCSSLKTLPSNIAGLKCLEKLDIDECEMLEYLPEDIGELPCLKVLYMDNCCSLKGLPSSLQKLDRLEVLTLNETKTMEILPAIVCELHSLKKLWLNSCSNLKELPSAFEGLTQLEELRMDYCEALEKLPELGKLSSLKYIYLEGCANLTSLPPSIVELKNLETLDIQYCTAIENARDIVGKLQCQVVPEYIGKLETLEELDLSSSNIRKFPYKISDLQSLKKLDMSSCYSIESLPDEMGMLTSLESLDISYCDKLEILPSGLCGMISLKTLNMDSCTSIKELPNDLGKLTSLEELNLSSCNSLESLPSSISELQLLKELKLSYCSAIQTLPNEIGMFTSLECVDISYCDKLKVLPSELCGMISLKTLNMASCPSIKQLPNDLGKLTSLEELNLSSCNSLESLPSSISELQLLKELNLSYCSAIQTLPDEIGMLSCLEDLNLRGCSNLKTLPSNIAGLKCLEKLDIDECEVLEYLPEEIGELPCLKFLYMANCSSLKSIPSSLKKLECLEVLTLNEWKTMETLPEIVCKLHSLKKLWLRNCSMLKELPPTVEGLIHLEELMMNHCKALEKLPELGKLCSLKYIHLEGCSNLKSLPPSIVELENLETLDIKYCKAIQNASEIVEKLKCEVLQATAEDDEEDEKGEEDKQGAIDEPDATLMDEGNLQEEVQKV